MMNRHQHLLQILSEECAETIKEISKALRFGTKSCYPGTVEPNSELINIEFMQAMAVWKALIDEGVLREPAQEEMMTVMEKKMARVEEFLEFSRKEGMLVED